MSRTQTLIATAPIRRGDRLYLSGHRSGSNGNWIFEVEPRPYEPLETLLPWAIAEEDREIGESVPYTPVRCFEYDPGGTMNFDPVEAAEHEELVREFERRRDRSFAQLLIVSFVMLTLWIAAIVS